MEGGHDTTVFNAQRHWSHVDTRLLAANTLVRAASTHLRGANTRPPLQVRTYELQATYDIQSTPHTRSHETDQIALQGNLQPSRVVMELKIYTAIHSFQCPVGHRSLAGY